MLIDGADVRMWKLSKLRGSIGLAAQDVFLFSDTIDGNVAYGNPDMPEEDVVKYAAAAAADPFIRKMEEGYNTIVGERGVGLSGGQRQRIALARAILKDAPIVVLDEATAFADPENEHQIQKAFEILTRNKTVLMIAHRLSTVQNADNIIVLSEGKIAEQGSHSALLERNGVYAAMWADYQRSAKWKVGKEAAV